MIDWKNISLKNLAGFISEELRKENIDAVLVGGACVSIYSNERYQSYDLDFVTYEDMRKVRKVLKKLGLKEKMDTFSIRIVPGLLNLFLLQLQWEMNPWCNLINLKLL